MNSRKLLGLGAALLATLLVLAWSVLHKPDSSRRGAANTEAQVEPTQPTLLEEPREGTALASEHVQPVDGQTDTRTSISSAPADEVSVRVFTHQLQDKRMPLRLIQFGLGANAPYRRGDPPIYRGRTDEAGLAEVSVPREWLAANMELSAGDSKPSGEELYAWVLQTGRAEAARRVRQDESGAFHVNLNVHSGQTIHGRVVTAFGQPVGDATISLTRAGYLADRSSPRTDDDGFFVLNVHWSRIEFLSATSAVWGSGQVKLDTVPGDPIPFCEIVVGGEGSIHGRVLHADGQPVVGLEVQVEHADRAAVIQDGLAQYDRRKGLAHWDFGTTVCQLTTDPEGRFKANGLLPGDYTIKARGGGHRIRDFDLTQAPVYSDGFEHVFRITAPQLFLRVTDPNAPEFDATQSVETGDRSSPTWPENLTIAVESLDHVRTKFWRRTEEETDSPALTLDGLFIYNVVAGGTYRVTAFGGEFAPTSRLVEIPDTAGRIDLELVLPSATQRGTIRFEPHLPPGQADSLPLQLRIRAAETGTLMWRGEGGFGKNGLWQFPRSLVALPAGRYQVTIDGRRDQRRIPNSFSSNPNDSAVVDSGTRSIGSWSGNIAVTAGATTLVAPTLSAGARVRILWITSPDLVVDNQVRFELRSRGKIPERVLFPSESFSDLPGLSVGSGATSAMVSPGSYTLAAIYPSGRATEQVLELRSGETATVRINVSPPKTTEDR